MKDNRQILFITGTGHCGSTLLDLLLGSHSKAFSLGEINKVLNKNANQKVCALCADDCSIWTPKLIKRLNKIYTYKFTDKVISKLSARWSPEVRFYDEIFKAARADVLIDSSKNPRWINKNSKKLTKVKYDVKLLYLSRDGRAVINSLNRKNKDKNITFLSKKWIDKIEKINKLYSNWKGPSMHIKYENLAKYPVEAINDILQMLNLGYEPEMMRFWEHKHHTVNGNAGTKTLVLKFQDAQRHNNVDWKLNKKGYYKNHELGIRFDERWKSELNNEDLKKIEEIISKNNKELINA